MDFAAKICKTNWASNYDKVKTSSDTTSGAVNPYASIIMQPKFENGYTDDERTIWNQ